MTDTLHEQLQTTLGDTYEFERELGGGGMSRVFLAGERSLGRMVVIKVLSPELAEGVRTDRFAREIKLAAALQHPNIVPLLSAGDANGIAYYTMPFVEGESLGGRLRAGQRLPIGEVVSLLKDVARALAFAHGKGVVHRDIKPDNVLMTGGVASVIDFGIAKAISAARTGDGAAEAGARALTTVGVSLGTPEYMAPEQALADQTSDHRVDIYAFGCLAYELLVGTSPFHGRSLQAIVMAHVTETPAPVEDSRPEVPSSLAELVARCLEKDPAKRPQTADEIVETLSAVSTEAFAVPRKSAKPGAGAGAAQRGGQSRTRRLVTVAVASLVVAAGAYAAASKLRGSGTAPAADNGMSIAVLPFDNVGGDTANAYFADGMADELISALSKVRELRVAARSSSFSMRGRNMSTAEIGKALNVGSVLEGTVYRAGGELRLTATLSSARTGLVIWSEKYVRTVRDVFAVQDAVAKEIVSNLQLTLGTTATGEKIDVVALAGTDDLEAYNLYLKGRYYYQRRGTDTRTGVGYFAQAVKRDPKFARAHAWLAMSTLGVAVFESTNPNQYKQAAIEAALRAVALDSTLADTHLALALTNQALFRWPAAGAQYEKALAIENSGPLRHQYGRWFLYQGRVSEGVQQLELANQLDPYSALTVAFMAHAYSLAGQHERAAAAAIRALQIDSTLVGAQSFAMRALLEAGKTAEARAQAVRSVRLRADIHVLGFAAYTLGKTGDRTRADSLIDVIRTKPGEEHRRSRALATAYLGVGDTASALSALERGLDSGDARPELNSFSDPQFDPLRGSPRLAAVIRRYGLDVAVLTSPKGGRPQ